MKRPAVVIAASALVAVFPAGCGPMSKSSRDKPGAGAVIYEATIITMDPARPSATAVAVKDGRVLAVGDIDDLVEGYSGAMVDESFARLTILPGFIDVSASVIDGARPAAAGVTSVADAAWRGEADKGAIAARWGSPERSGYGLYLVADETAFGAAYGDEAPGMIGDLASGAVPAPAPVLPFAAFAAASCSENAADAPASELAAAFAPYWTASLGPRIRADNEAARARVFAALEALLRGGAGRRAIIEVAGPIGADELARAAMLGAGVIASDDELLEGCAAAQPVKDDEVDDAEAAGSEVSEPVAPLTGRIALSSRALGLVPLRAAGARIAAGEGLRLSPWEALEAITIDAAFALGREAEIGSIAPGKRADFTVLYGNPLATAAEEWGAIRIWGTIRGGELRPQAAVAGSE